MTAGHVVYIKNSGVPGRDGWVRSINVMPGRNGSTLPYGSVTSSNFRTVNGWADNGDENYDYGAIIIPTELGNTSRLVRLRRLAGRRPASVGRQHLRLSRRQARGNPVVRPPTIASVEPRKVFYDIDTCGGQSGSAVYRIIDGSRYGIRRARVRRRDDQLGTRIVTAGLQQHGGLEGVRRAHLRTIDSEGTPHACKADHRRGRGPRSCWRAGAAGSGVHRSRSGTGTRFAALTDAEGRFTLSLPAGGIYEMACVAERYAPSSATVEVADESADHQVLRLELRLTADRPGR